MPRRAKVEALAGKCDRLHLKLNRLGSLGYHLLLKVAVPQLNKNDVNAAAGICRFYT